MQKQFERHVAGLSLGIQFHVSRHRVEQSPQSWKRVAKALFRRFKRLAFWIGYKVGRAWNEIATLAADWNRSLSLDKTLALDRRAYEKFPPRLAMVALEIRWKRIRAGEIHPANEQERWLKSLTRRQFYIQLAGEWRRRGRFAGVEFSADLSRVGKEAERGKQLKQDVKSETGQTIGMDFRMDSPEVTIAGAGNAVEFDLNSPSRKK